MDNGYGQYWLLLRGLGRQSAHWGDFPERLQRAFPQATIECLDLPGSGNAHDRSSPNAIPAITEALRQRVLMQGPLQTPLTLLGLSLGGMVSWHWLQNYPDEIAAGILINSSFANLSPCYRRLRWQAWAKVAALVGQNRVLARERAIVDLVSNRTPLERRQIAETWAEIDGKQPMRWSTVINQLHAAARFYPTLQKPATPVLLINSLADRMVSPTCSQAIAQNLALPLVSHPRAGHDIPLDAPDWLIEQLFCWSTAR